jgi:hypothetical protein
VIEIGSSIKTEVDDESVSISAVERMHSEKCADSEVRAKGRNQSVASFEQSRKQFIQYTCRCKSVDRYVEVH